MTEIFLIRHAANDWVGRALAGWTPGVHLNAEGRRQAQWLAPALSASGIGAIYSSPLDRAMETAEPLADALGLKVEPREEFGEIRFGDWTGREIAAMESDPLWQRFNRFRSSTRIPGGETMLEVQQRMVSGLEGLRRDDGKRVAVFSHGDPIRAALAHFAGIPLDLLDRLEVAPASVSRIGLADWGARVISVNEGIWLYQNERPGRF